MSEFKVWECIICGVIYNEKLGWPAEGLAPGTRWEDVPEDWLCPDCGVGKDDFEMTEVELETPSGLPF
ncbi:rubredoxin [Pseudomaricurvus alkylphenolicus]|uniref:rubredoxin n=1 Tax=Pseudomaricurvus alkylphenolicus TaxID=1306991 RepID=UPI0014247E12|nr:rubredoxin [Pseudomaricurvus alkylphenolicus]NIB45175.1 rubredoxin [Pseudomaricurvus alkylphenolicus]